MEGLAVRSCFLWPVSLNGWVFVYELSACGFESSCSCLNFRFPACFEQGVPRHSGNCRVWFTLKHDMTRTHSQVHRTDKNSQHSSIILASLSNMVFQVFMKLCAAENYQTTNQHNHWLSCSRLMQSVAPL